MRNRKKRQRHISLESELKRLSTEQIKKDPRHRTRSQILASSLWSRALSGDRESLKMLLERLPQSTPEAEPRGDVANAASGATTFDQVTNALRSLVAAGILPSEAFEKFRIKKLDEEFDS